jgi:hypothetical protein
MSRATGRKEGSSSFLQKKTKRLLNPRASLSGEAAAEQVKVFLLLFFKKEDLACRSAA